MEMHQVRYFLAVARQLNFTKAAEECNVAQPSLSRAIKKLEDELGGDLFRRERSLTHLTDLGQLMLPLLKQCHESADAAKNLATSYKKGNCAPLRLALSHTINLELVVPHLTELMAAFKGLELKFHRGTSVAIIEHLKAGGSELALTGPVEEDWERLDFWPLFAENFDLVINGHHTLATRKSIDITELRGERLLARPYCEQATEVSELLQGHGIVASSGDRIVSDHDLLALIEANVGVSILPRSATQTASLRKLAIEGLGIRRMVYLIGVAGRQRSPAATALIKMLRGADWTAVSQAGIETETHADAL